jgi:Ser/Thr protein kinase RdoA (MazF antagonist)
MASSTAVDADSSSSSDEVMRKLLKPDPTPQQVIDVLKKSYAKDEDDVITIKRELDSYDDKNYWVTIGDTEYLAKVHNGVESKDLLDCSAAGDVTQSVIYLQTTMMRRLAQQGLATSEPQTPTTTSNTAMTMDTPASVHELPVVSAEHSPCPLVVRLMSWVPGRPMESVTLLPLESLADAGRFLGKMQLAFLKQQPQKDVPAAAKRYHQWDGKHTKDLSNFVSYITDDSKRRMVESVIATFTKELIDSKVAEDSFPTALIHGDFNDANILVDQDLLTSGVIDFGDSVERCVLLLLFVFRLRSDTKTRVLASNRVMARTDRLT